MFTGVKGAFIGAKFSNENDGLLISDIVKDSPAAKAGMKEGDVVSGLNGTDVRDHESFLPMLATHKPGDTITLTIRRGKEYLDVPVVLGERPANTLPPGFHLPGEEPEAGATTKPMEKDATTKPIDGK
jgi:S1-C subfamily serine protease